MNELLMTILLAIITAATPVIVGQVFRWLQSLINKNKTMAKTKIDDIILETAKQVITGITKPLADKYKKAKEDGKLTEDEKKRLFEDAKFMIKGALKEKGIKAGEKIFKAVIEHIVRSLE